MSFVFVGVDSALTNTGLFAYEPHVWHKRHSVKPKKRTGPARLEYIRDETAKWLDQLPNITYAAIEDGSFGSEGRLYQLGGIQHILQLVLWERVEGALIEVAPAQLKKFQTGKSGARKKWMKDKASAWLLEHTSKDSRIRKRYWDAHEVKDDNIADAIGLARIAHALYTEEVKTRAQAEVVVSLQKSKRIHEVP